MRSNKIFLAFLNLFLAACLCSCSVKTNNISNTNDKIKNYNVVVDSADSAISDEDKNLIKSQAQIALKNVPEYLGIKKLDENVSGGDIHITVKNDIAVSYYGGSSYIYIAKEAVDAKKIAVVHEITHFLTFNDPSGNVEYNFVSEGIAQLMQELYGEKGDIKIGNNELLNKKEYSETLNAIKEGRKYYMSIPELVEHSNYYSPDNFKERDKEAKIRTKIAYIESTSFFLFLNDKYGEKKIRELYHSEKGTDFDKTCKKVFKKNLREIEKEWRNYYGF